jgi:hypothetical protein
VEDLAGAVFWQLRRPFDPIRRGGGADPGAHDPDQLPLKIVAPGNAFLQGHEAENTLSLNPVRKAHGGSFCDGRVGRQRSLDLHRPEPVARQVDDIVQTADDPVVAVRIPLRPVACEVIAGKNAEIGLEETLAITGDGAGLSGPGIREAQIAHTLALHDGTLIGSPTEPSTCRTGRWPRRSLVACRSGRCGP